MSNLVITNPPNYPLPNDLIKICLEYLDQESLKLASRVNAKIKKLIVDDMFEQHIVAWLKNDSSNMLFERATSWPLIPLTNDNTLRIVCMLTESSRIWRTMENHLVFWLPFADNPTYASFNFIRNATRDWAVIWEERTCLRRTDFGTAEQKDPIFSFNESFPNSSIITPNYICPLASTPERLLIYRSNTPGDLERVTEKIRDKFEEFITGKEKIPCHKRVWKAIVNAWNAISQFFERVWAVVFKFFKKRCPCCQNKIHFYNGPGPTRHFYNGETASHLYVHGGEVPAEYQNADWQEV